VLSTPGPQPAAATSETGPADRRPITAAERTAPTIVSEGALTADESGEGIQSQAGTMPTMIAGQKQEAEPGFAGTPQPTMVVHSHSAAALPQPSAPAQRRSPLPFVAIGIVVLLLVVGAGGYAVIHFMSSSANTNSGKTDPSKSATTTDPALGGHEVGRYWLEVDTKNKVDAVRAGDSVAMQSGQSFRFHFSPSENGYLYIVGPGNKNVPTTFLTTTPRAESGVFTNEVKSGLDFTFPGSSDGKDHWITLDQNAGIDEFTIIFVTSPLTSHAFFYAQAGHELTAGEQQQLKDMREQFKANAASTEVIKTGAAPFVSVKVPQNADGSPVIFMVRVEHK
jgi:hypothetical protein